MPGSSADIFFACQIAYRFQKHSFTKDGSSDLPEPEASGKKHLPETVPFSNVSSCRGERPQCRPSITAPASTVIAIIFKRLSDSRTARVRVASFTLDIAVGCARLLISANAFQIVSAILAALAMISRR